MMETFHIMVIFVQSKMVATSHMWNWALEMWLVPLKGQNFKFNFNSSSIFLFLIFIIAKNIH